MHVLDMTNPEHRLAYVLALQERKTTSVSLGTYLPPLNQPGFIEPTTRLPKAEAAEAVLLRLPPVWQGIKAVREVKDKRGCRLVTCVVGA